MTDVSIKCYCCGDTYTLEVREEDLEEYLSPNRRYIQDIFPYLKPCDRELFISHTCDKCFKYMFGQD